MFHQLILAFSIGLALAAPSLDKVDPMLKNVISTSGRANVVVSFNQDTHDIINNINSMGFGSRAEKITAMKTQLEELQTSSQNNVLNLFSSRSVKFQSLWINNQIYIEDATMDLVSAIAAIPEVVEIREQFIASIIETPQSDANDAVEWNIERIEADKAWALDGGNQGEGVVVATIDTGVRATHEALQDHHRTSYGWLDPYDGTDLPSDENGHGTHIMGVITGSGGIGVAPKAQWIACRGCSSFSCTEAAIMTCGQWMVCPTLADGRSPNCSMAPQIVSNSWGGGQGQTWFDPIIYSWRGAGIVPVFAIGSSGPSCGTIGSPGDHPLVIAVGATSRLDTISTFSSRGPSGGGSIKPDIVAPGQDIRSAFGTSDTAYSTISGTSAAAPHAAGTVALLLSEDPSLSYENVKELLQVNADRNHNSTGSCGNIPPGQWPNNEYGHGRVNARKALAAAISN